MTRDEILTLLPFQANGTLTGAEARAVAEAVAADTGLQQDLAALVALRAAMQAEPVQSPGAFGLARLTRSLDDIEAARHKASRPWIWQAAAAVALAAFLGQAVVVWLVPAGRDVTLASGTDAAGLTVAFAPQATEAAIRDLLLSHGLQVVGGPSALGLWQVAGDDLAGAAAGLAASALVESVEQVGDGQD